MAAFELCWRFYSLDNTGLPDTAGYKDDDKIDEDDGINNVKNNIGDVAAGHTENERIMVYVGYGNGDGGVQGETVL